MRKDDKGILEINNIEKNICNTYIKNKNYYIKEIDPKLAKKLIIKYHYSHKVVPNSSLHLGIFDNITDDLIGVLQYGTPMNAKSTPQKIVKNATSNEMYELNRMAMLDEAPKLCESQAIGLSIKWIRKHKPHIKWLLSFSDGKQGNVGIIYQATNWVYLGFRLSDSFYKCDNEVLHSVQIWHKFKEGKPDVNTMDEVYKHFNNVSKIVSRQHIYVFPIQKVEYMLHQAPYPKKETEPTIIKETIYKKDGVILNKPIVITY